MDNATMVSAKVETEVKISKKKKSRLNKCRLLEKGPAHRHLPSAAGQDQGQRPLASSGFCSGVLASTEASVFPCERRPRRQ